MINIANDSERARRALEETHRERRRVLYLVKHRPNRVDVLELDRRRSPDWSFALVGALCAALILAALYFSL